MPQGITGAPATFQRLMERAVSDMHLLQVLVYLDDIIVFGKTLEEHEERLLKVLDRLEEVGLKVSIDKCQFCQPQVKYVGHIVSEFGIATDPEKVEVVTHWKRPTDLKSLRSFLGFCGYYRRFIANYSAIVRPLTELTKGYPPVQRARTAVTGKTKFYFKESEPFGERWDPTCTAAFQKIINCLTNAPVLAFADPTQPYVLHVDASMDGLGAVLNQEYPEGLRPVAFASRKLSASEQHYPIHQLEFLALKWAVVDKFHDYLYGARFTVRTDNNPLTYVLTTAKLNATGHRWLAALATYDFSVQYRPGKHNIDADLLSRNPHCKKTEGEWMDIPQPGIKALCKQVSINGGSVPKRPVTRGQTVQKQRRKELRENSPNEQGGVTTESEDEETYQHNHLDLDEVRRQVQEFSEQPENIITVEKESEVVNEDEHHSSHEDPELEEATLLEGAETEVNPHPFPDAVADTDLDGGDVLTSSDSVNNEGPSCKRTTRREVKPVVYLSYDELGKPSDRPLTIIHNGIVIQFSDCMEPQANSSTRDCQKPLVVCSNCIARPCHLPSTMMITCKGKRKEDV
ncbi:hypothetical protein SKAU_G00415830 [Synaphobranchus kaupii]|uniref:ribonuclease H n=1 Tax=Synaphobranchus kaupii TaxID=118154 RepID=A0A9Q1E7C8_SYNKA|nr:hypothetical protein SKAU_G00415830 [Synaphobranchus kaupii]